MSLAALEIQVSADIAELQKNLKDGKVTVKDFEQSMLASTNSLKKFESALKKSTDPKEIKSLENSISSLKGKLETLNASQNNLLGSTNKMVVGTNQANNALTNLGRVAQDAPFGFIGIQNNLNPLLESFQRLKQSTGSNVASFKALAGSLMGAGGIGLALSVVSSLYLAFGDNLTSVSAKVQRAEAAHKSYVDTMSSGVGAAKEEIATSQSLIGIITNVSNSTNDRTTALKKLQEKYPNFLELQKADINDVKLLTALQAKLSKAIIARAKVQGLADIIAKEETDLIKLQNQSNAQTKDKATAFGQVVGFLGNATNANLKFVASQFELATGIEQTGIQASEAKDRIALYTKELEKATLAQIQSDEGVGLGKKGGKSSKGGSKIKETFLDKLADDLRINEAKFNNRLINFDTFIKNNNDAYNKAIEEGIKLNSPQTLIDRLRNEITVLASGTSQAIIPLELKVNPTLTADASKLAPQMAAFNAKLLAMLYPPKEQLTAFQIQLGAIYNQTLVNAFTGVGDAIAASLSGANLFDGLFNNLLKTFGEGIQQVGKQMIIGSKLLIGISSAFKAGKFGESLLGGIALVALGGALKSIKIGANAQGTDYWKGGLTMVGERGPELVNLPRGASVTPNHDLGSIGGGMAVNIQPMTVFRGTDLIVYFNRVTQLNNRI